jgi:hypothetical protein
MNVSPSYPANTPPEHIGWYDTDLDDLTTTRSWWNGEYWQETQTGFGKSISEHVLTWNGQTTPPTGRLEEAIRAALDPIELEL